MKATTISQTAGSTAQQTVYSILFAISFSHLLNRSDSISNSGCLSDVKG